MCHFNIYSIENVHVIDIVISDQISSIQLKHVHDSLLLPDLLIPDEDCAAAVGGRGQARLLGLRHTDEGVQAGAAAQGLRGHRGFQVETFTELCFLLASYFFVMYYQGYWLCDG